MNSFWDLVKFEYKKIFKRKSTIIVLSLVAIIIIIGTIANYNGNIWHSATEGEREIIHSKAGIADEKIIKEAIEQNSIMAANDENYMINEFGKFAHGDAYCKYTMPYENIVNMINTIYEADVSNISVTEIFETINVNLKKPIDSLTADDASKFYNLYKKQTINLLNSRNLSLAEKEKHLQMLSSVKKPFYNDYFGGYAVFAIMLNGLGMVILTAIAICVAPIFSNEYQTRADQIILSSKYGKNKIILAKIFTGITFAILTSLATSILFLTALFCLHGITGYNVSLQFLNYFTTYPLTMLQAVLISILVFVLICMAFAMFIMILSSLFKSTFGVIIISFLMIFVPACIYVPYKYRFLYQLVQLLPTKAISFPSIFSEYLFDLFGAVLTPATFYCIFSILLTIILIPFCYRGFKNHQVA